MRAAILPSLSCGQDVDIDVNCIFAGKVTIGAGAQIGANCHHQQCTIADDTRSPPPSPTSMAKGRREVGQSALIGLFARLRPGANWAARVHMATLSKLKTPPWPTAPGPITWPIWRCHGE